MTTNIKINAHCNPDTTVVRVSKAGGPHVDQDVTLRDGETHELHVCDDELVTVQEVPIPTD